MLYLDNSATTQVHSDVYNEMLPYLSQEYGNPSSKYYSLAINSKNAIEQSRQHVANLVNSKKMEVVFTSGASESNNTVLKGVAEYYSEKGKHIITTKTEHKAILDVCSYLEKKGFNITYLDVDSYGRVDPEDVRKNITSETILVSVIWGNNELGSLNDIHSISNICEECGVLFHSDATQVAGKLKMNFGEINGLSFLSLSAHKLHGPKGVGALIVRSDEYGKLTPFTPLIHGGGQENDLRSGTHSVHNIVGFGKAAEIANNNLKENIISLKKLEEKLIELLTTKFKDNISFNSDNTNKIPGIVNVRFHGLNNEILLKKLSPLIAASTGSACSSTNPSYVLLAIGLSLNEVRESVRFSFSPYTQIKDLDIFQDL